MSLSDKRKVNPHINGIDEFSVRYSEKDVRDAVKELKNKISYKHYELSEELQFETISRWIAEIFGEKLTE